MHYLTPNYPNTAWDYQGYKKPPAHAKDVANGDPKVKNKEDGMQTQTPEHFIPQILLMSVYVS
jgi:hypothetical protein